MARQRVVVGGALALVAIVGLIWAYLIAALDPGRPAAVLDELEIPATWDLADTEIVKNILFGSRVVRYYLVDADPDDIVDPASDMLAAAGFTIDVRLAPRDWCDNRPIGATPAIECPTKRIPVCQTNGQGGPMTCYLWATRGDDRLSIVAFDRGERAKYFVGSEGRFVGAPGRIVVRVSIDY